LDLGRVKRPQFCAPKLVIARPARPTVHKSTTTQRRRMTNRAERCHEIKSMIAKHVVFQRRWSSSKRQTHRYNLTRNRFPRSNVQARANARLALADASIPRSAWCITLYRIRTNRYLNTYRCVHRWKIPGRNDQNSPTRRITQTALRWFQSTNDRAGLAWLAPRNRYKIPHRHRSPTFTPAESVVRSPNRPLR
jgi:hypothetical protein